MSNFSTHLQRLFDPASCVVLLEFPRPSDWPVVAGLLEKLSGELELPLPALSVQGKAGFRLWFSAAKDGAPGELRALVEALCRTHLADLPPARVRITVPTKDELVFPPQEGEGSGAWTAFIAPDMGGMFTDDCSLPMAAGAEAQAEMLIGVRSLKGAEVRQAMEKLSASGQSPAEGCPPAALGAGQAGRYREPIGFLLAVMNDSAANPALRVEAAKALLPYFARPLADPSTGD